MAEEICLECKGKLKKIFENNHTKILKCAECGKPYSQNIATGKIEPKRFAG